MAFDRRPKDEQDALLETLWCGCRDRHFTISTGVADAFLFTELHPFVFRSAFSTRHSRHRFVLRRALHASLPCRGCCGRIQSKVKHCYIVFERDMEGSLDEPLKETVRAESTLVRVNICSWPMMTLVTSACLPLTHTQYDIFGWLSEHGCTTRERCRFRVTIKRQHATSALVRLTGDGTIGNAGV